MFGVQVCGIVAVRTTVNNLCMIVMANVDESYGDTGSTVLFVCWL